MARGLSPLSDFITAFIPKPECCASKALIRSARDGGNVALPECGKEFNPLLG